MLYCDNGRWCYLLYGRTLGTELVCIDKLLVLPGLVDAKRQKGDAELVFVIEVLGLALQD